MVVVVVVVIVVVIGILVVVVLVVLVVVVVVLVIVVVVVIDSGKNYLVPVHRKIFRLQSFGCNKRCWLRLRYNRTLPEPEANSQNPYKKQKAIIVTLVPILKKCSCLQELGYLKVPFLYGRYFSGYTE